VTGKIAYVNKISRIKLKNKIVCIISADPGYDYIFSKKIKGLVTMFGGVNSHMAIRCSELGIPAAIGVGERVFKEIANSKIARLNTISKKIDIIN
jgi:phosphoenolpyruvate-protein kinase (PTS system EI component)